MRNVPDKWQSDRLKDIAKINNRALSANTDPDYEFDYLEISNVNYHGIIDPQAIERLRYEDAPSRARRKLGPGNTVISSVRPNLQAVAFIENDRSDFVCSTGFNVVEPFTWKLLPKFAYYALISEGTRQYLEAAGKGVGYPAVDDKDFNSIEVLIPALPEQKRVAAYLDISCAAIDAALASKRQQIDTLDEIRLAIIAKAVTSGITPFFESRDSGVAWIGKIPKHWKVEKLKYLASLIVDGTHVTPTYVQAGIPFLRVTDIQNDTIDLDTVKYITHEEHQQLTKRVRPKHGDLLLSKNGTIGLVKTVTWDWEFSFFVSLCLIRPTLKLNTKFLEYYFQSNIVDQQLFESSKKTSVTNLHLIKIRELLICTPSREEQEAICTYLDEKLCELSRVRCNIESQITTLTAFRKSLIHECVTGQRRVTDEDIKRAEAQWPSARDLQN